MERERVLTCAGLVPGDVVQAHVGAVLQFIGCVTETQAEHELFWAVDSIGQRRLIDLGSYEVYRLYPPYL